MGRIKLSEQVDGFSVVELMITLGIITVVFGTFLVAFTSIQHINKKSLDFNKINLAAFEKMQEYETKNFVDIPVTAPTGTLTEVEDFSSSLPSTLEKPKVAKVYINTVSNSLKQVLVRVTVSTGDGQKIIEYVNFIHSNGLGR